MTDIVVDASIVAAWMLPDEQNRAADALLEAAAEGAGLAAPWLFWAELRNILIVNERRGRIEDGTAEAFLEALRDIPLAFDTTPEERRVLGLARTHGLTVYDALYLELAMRKSASLASLDTRLVSAAQAEGVLAQFGV